MGGLGGPGYLPQGDTEGYINAKLNSGAPSLPGEPSVLTESRTESKKNEKEAEVNWSYTTSRGG